MYKKLILAGFALALSTLARAEIFPEGYTFTYYFDTLPGSQETEILPENTLTMGGFPQTGHIEWQIFDSLPTGTPVASGLWIPTELEWGFALLPNGVWEDGEGSFSIQIIQGAQQIDSFEINVNGPFDPVTQTTTVFRAFVPPAPVPEMGTVGYLGLGFALMALWRRRAQGQAS